MEVLLSLETSTHAFSCALHRDGKLIAFKESVEQQKGASLLAVMVDQMFEETDMQRDGLDGVVVAAGPGSYTGLRIGVATAKGICFALNVPLISVNTLTLMFRQFEFQSPVEMSAAPALFCPMLDARRMEVYCLVCDREGNVLLPVQAKVIDEGSFAEQLSEQPVYFFGEGADKCKDTIRHPNARFVPGIKPLASTLGVIGFQKYRDNELESSEHFEPLYLKDFVIRKPNLIS